jgi:hypothetical protein
VEGAGVTHLLGQGSSTADRKSDHTLHTWLVLYDQILFHWIKTKNISILALDNRKNKLKIA